MGMGNVSLVDGVTGQIVEVQGGEEVQVGQVLQRLPQRSVWEVEVGKRGKELAASTRLQAGKLYLLRPSPSFKRSLCEQGLWGSSIRAAPPPTYPFCKSGVDPTTPSTRRRHIHQNV